MPIVIENETAGRGDATANMYVLSINDQPMVRFAHDRRKGLAACLRDAADALDRKNGKG